jgi:hypothetical protein
MADEGADGLFMRTIASRDCAIAASAERSPASMRRWRSASEIMKALPVMTRQVTDSLGMEQA